MRASLIAATLFTLVLSACSSPNATTPTLTLVSVFPLNGPNGALGLAMQHAVDLAVQQNSSPGGGYHLAVAHVDESLGSASQVVAADIASGGVVGVVGPFSSESALTIEPIIEHAGVVTITPSATLAGLTQASGAQAEGLTFAQLRPQGAAVAFLRLPQTGPAEGKAAADIALSPGPRGLNANSFFVVDDGTATGNEIVTAFRAELTGRHGSIAGHASISGGNLSNPMALIAAIVAAGPSGVFYAGDTLAGAQLRGALTLSGVPGLPLLVAGPAANNPGWSDAVGGQAISGNTMALDSARDLGKSSTAQAFVAAYQAAYPGAAPLPQAALAYDAAMDEITALKAVLAAGKSPAASAVLAGVTGGAYQGVTGAITFDKNGDDNHPLPFSVYTSDNKGAWSYRGALNA